MEAMAMEAMEIMVKKGMSKSRLSHPKTKRVKKEVVKQIL